MKFGVCTTADNWAAAAAAGCDYGELSFQSVAGMEQEAFDGLCAQIGQSGFASEVMNSFLPGSCRLTGDAADHEAALAFAEAGFDRAVQAGAKVVVFGSGMARQVPEGFSVREAAGQVSAFAGKAAALAAQRGIVLAIEPLGTGECNLIHTVSEALEICAL
ncbi:MAG: TIM barrel protein, partial [Eubacteriales bacterium]|nr:TIM barrel protein [Eubacteriales bacterium]